MITGNEARVVLAFDFERSVHHWCRDLVLVALLRRIRARAAEKRRAYRNARRDARPRFPQLLAAERFGDETEHFGFADEEVKHGRPDQLVECHAENDELRPDDVVVDDLVHDSRDCVELHEQKEPENRHDPGIDRFVNI